MSTEDLLRKIVQEADDYYGSDVGSLDDPEIIETTGETIDEK